MTSDNRAAPDNRAALAAVIDTLACPKCAAPVAIAAQAVRCGNGHSYDIARQGYGSFLVGHSPHTGDTAEMVAARDTFLRGGHYDAIAAAVSAAVTASGAVSASARLVVDLAAGTGYYVGRVLDDDPDAVGLAIDVSAAAARRAARAHERAACVTADAWGTVPVRDDAASVVLSIFGPRGGGELLRILRPGGVVVAVTPRADHLRQLRERFGMIAIGDEKDARLEAQLAPLRLRDRVALDYELLLSPAEVLDLVFMGPSAFHLNRAEVAATLDPSCVPVSVAVTLCTFG